MKVKVAILAGGLGTRLYQETKPKPMAEIGGQPILWHIMMHYSHYGFNDFVIALGYKGEIIKKYFIENRSSTSKQKLNSSYYKIKIDFGLNKVLNVEFVDTGIQTSNGGRIKRLAKYLDKGTFMLTWADGLSDVNLQELLAFHRSHGKLATVTAVNPPTRYGYLKLRGNQVVLFSEKPKLKKKWINGAFFVLEPGVFQYIDGDDTTWEREPLERLATEGQLMGYKHKSFWQCMDTMHEKQLLDKLWQSGKAPWKVWD